jgi:radical SAM superfamily enzyme YgiQ (UPF0313 family)
MESVDVLLINPPFHTRNGGGSFFPLGLGYIISSVVAHRYTWGVIDCTKMIDSFYQNELCKFEEELLIKMQKYSPLMIGMGPCITSQLRALKVISNCCQKVFPSIPVIAGGPLVSIEGQEWFFNEDLGLDYIIKGDGEQAIPDAIRAIKDTGSVANSTMLSKQGYTFLNEIKDINPILFPYRGLHGGDIFSTRRSISNTHQTQAAMITSRGCPYSCNYCVSGNLKTNKTVRKRSVNNIIQEMEDLHQNCGINDVTFYDDCFFSNVKTASADIKSFCDELLHKELHMTWQIELRPDLLLSLNDDSIHLLENSGCRQINLGIEKGSDEGLRFLGKTSSLTGLRQKNLHIKKISRINLSATFILGGGTETRNDVIQLVEESKSLELDFAHYNPLFVYPGTPLYKLVFNNDRTWADIISNDSLPWGEIVFENDSLKCPDLLELVDYAYMEFYKNTEYASQQMIVDRFNIKRGR